jgi:hypothetical protein
VAECVNQVLPRSKTHDNTMSVSLDPLAANRPKQFEMNTKVHYLDLLSDKGGNENCKIVDSLRHKNIANHGCDCAVRV